MWTPTQQDSLVAISMSAFAILLAYLRRRLGLRDRLSFTRGMMPSSGSMKRPAWRRKGHSCAACGMPAKTSKRQRSRPWGIGLLCGPCRKVVLDRVAYLLATRGTSRS